jgi:hypothetical protein
VYYSNAYELPKEETTYFLENWRGPEGIRLYEKILRPGEQHVLRHGYIFHIPGVLATPTDSHFLITLMTP